jgi:hypothetical protein
MRCFYFSKIFHDFLIDVDVEGIWRRCAPAVLPEMGTSEAAHGPVGDYRTETVKARGISGQTHIEAWHLQVRI